MEAWKRRKRRDRRSREEKLRRFLRWREKKKRTRKWRWVAKQFFTWKELSGYDYCELLISHFHIDLLSFSAILLGIDLLRGAFQGPYVCFVGSTLCMHALSWLYILVSLFFSGKYALILLGVWWVKILLLFLVDSTCISPFMLPEMRLYTFLFCLFSYLTFSPFLLWLLFLFFLFCFWCVWGAKYHSWIGRLLG